MPLTILSVAWPFAPVGPDAVGGAEQILTALDDAIVRHGHQSLVVACAGSEVAGTFFPVHVPEDQLDHADRPARAGLYQGAIDAALASASVDLIHMHGLDFHEYRLSESIPVLVTLHLPPSWYPAHIWGNRSPNVQLQCVSHSQRDACPPGAGGLPVIKNGVDLPALGDLHAEPLPLDLPSEFAVALGRICPEKNLHAALEAATLARIPVLIGGKVFPWQAHEDYFRDRILPLLTEGHQFLGPLAPALRHQLLRLAKCLLLPTLAPETSSLVAMEALAAGTPVVAWPSGAIPEIIEDGVTGFLVDSVEAMAKAIRSVDSLDRSFCRAAAERRFSRDRMIRDYFRLYERCIEDASAATQMSRHA